MEKSNWTAIVVTCFSPELAECVGKELELMKKYGSISTETTTVAIADPQPNIGSGGATINAVLVISEMLSAKEGYHTLTSDVLRDSKILLVHMGRHFIFDSCGRAFTCLPYSNESSVGLVTNFDLLLHTVTENIAINSHSGLWVCSSDMMLSVPEEFTVEQSYFESNQNTAICFSAPSTVEYALNHGVYCLNENNDLKNIIFQGSKAEVEACKVDGTEQVPIVSGIVFFPVSIAEKILSMHTLSPLDSCTYYGADNEIEPQKLSLFFDIILCMVEDINKLDFVSGCRSGSFGKQNCDKAVDELVELTRSQVWNTLKGTKATCYYMKEATFKYIDMTYSPLDFCKFLQNTPSFNSKFEYSNIVHSHLAIKTGYKNSNLDICTTKVSSKSIVINSCIGEGTIVEKNTIIMHCSIPEGLRIGKNCYLNGLDFESFKSLNSKEIPDNLMIVQLKTMFPNNKVKDSFLIFNNDVNFCQPLSKETSSNELISSFQNKTTIESCGISAFLSKVHPTFHIQYSVTLQDSLDSFLNNNFKQGSQQYWYLSAADIIGHVDIQEEFKIRSEQFCKVATLKIIDDLNTNTRYNNTNKSSYKISKYFKYFVNYGYVDSLLNVLDQNAIDAVKNNKRRPDICARVLACTADVLEVMAPKITLLRSGPSLNKEWKRAFQHLKNNELELGIKEMLKVRQRWMKDKMLLIRAARHYEGAAQLLISNSVMSVCMQVSAHKTSSRGLSKGKWLVAESPARIDLSGGWSDTPPICYEYGGCVVNAAVLLNGKRPIGARLRRLQEPVIKFCLLSKDMEPTQSVICKSTDDLLTYKKPSSPAALLKACVILTRIIDPQNVSSFSSQLAVNFEEGGFELQTWSLLPTGSGMGTSSILAGAVLKVLFQSIGVEVDTRSVVHAVLVLEQMLTTGYFVS